MDKMNYSKKENQKITGVLNEFDDELDFLTVELKSINSIYERKLNLELTYQSELSNIRYDKLEIDLDKLIDIFDKQKQFI